MKRAVRSCLVIAAVLGAGTGCYQQPVAWMTADVELDDGTRFHFAATERTSHTDDMCALEALDDARRFGLTFLWPAATTGGMFSLGDPAGPLRLVITRPHPTKSDEVRLSQVTQGVVLVDRWNQWAGCSFEGTFEDVRLDRSDADDTAHLAVSHGIVAGAP